MKKAKRWTVRWKPYAALPMAERAALSVGQRLAARFVLRLVPAGDTIQPGAAMADLVECGDLLGDNGGGDLRRH